MNPTLGPKAEGLSPTANEALRLPGRAWETLDQTTAAKVARPVLQDDGARGYESNVRPKG